MTTTPLRQPRIPSLLLPVITGGVSALALALWTLATSPDPHLAVGLLALLAAGAFAEAFPVPLEPAGEVSLAAVFIAGAALTYDWAAAVVVATLAVVLVDGLRRRQPVQFAYNASVYGLSGAAAGGAVVLLSHGTEVTSLLLGSIGAISAFFVTNMVLTTAVISRVSGRPFGSLLRSNARANVGPFAIMGSVSLMLAVLWNESALLMGALAGPLVAVALYQRSMHRAMAAMRLALTDAHTGLGNKRHFEELLQRSLDRADETGKPFTLCLVDLDDFKSVNDMYGHPAGDKVLSQVAARLRRGGESFRLGGDEFALLLPDKTAEEGREIAEAVARRIANTKFEHGGPVTVSVGVASYPSDGVTRSELVRVTDEALYTAKGRGKARVCVYQPGTPVPPAPGRTSVAGHPVDLQAAADAANAFVSRDVFIGGHSQDVRDLAGRLAGRLGLEAEQVELVRIAGAVHDIGKLLVPEELLYKPGPLTAVERAVTERHSEIGHQMLRSMLLEPVATWVLHHHERWDGGGYPSGLAGEQIPLAARILFVADSFDTMTTERVHRARMSGRDALSEIERCSGTEFDPAVVAALREELADAPLELVLPASA
jgi:diguanylate cyclase (GGDEF)-like protein